MLTIVNSSIDGTTVNRGCEDFLWLTEQLSLIYPGLILSVAPAIEGVQFPSARSGDSLANYLERCRSTADRYVQRLSSHEEIAGAECVVAFLYATDSVWEREKPRLEAEARIESVLGNRSIARVPNEAFNSGLSWTSLKQTIFHGGQEDLNILTTAGGKEATLDQLSGAQGTGEWSLQLDNELKRLATQEQRHAADGTILDAESSQVRRAVAMAAFREAERERRAFIVKKNCDLLGYAFQQRAEAMGRVSTTAKALGRTDVDDTVSKLLLALAARLGDEAGAVNDVAAPALNKKLANAIDETRLASRTARAALLSRAAVADALGDANGAAARAKTRHARAEATLAALRERRSAAIQAASTTPITETTSHLSKNNQIRVVEAFPSVENTQNNHNLTRAVRLESENTPLEAALAARGRNNRRRRSSLGTNARDAATATCAAAARLPEQLNCGSTEVQRTVGRMTEVATCGGIKPSPKLDSVTELNLQLRAAQRQADTARRDASLATERQAKFEAAVAITTRRLARNLLNASAYRASDLKNSLADYARSNISHARAQAQAWQAVHDAIHTHILSSARINDNVHKFSGVMNRPVVIAQSPSLSSPASALIRTTHQATPVVAPDEWYRTEGHL
mmetsp:Transcript_11780/g.14385  ORF Transcript_11780/g.14385 Transcript_11780/m.14385 type:complete len:628 (+) Transcript_11780:1-1884(+)